MRDIKIRHHVSAVDARGTWHTIQENDLVEIITFDRTRVFGQILHIGIDTIQITGLRGDFSIPCSDIEEIDLCD